MTTIGENIKKERTKANLSQSQLADKLYVDRTTISKWENNKAQPQKEDLKKIADVLQISENNLADDKDLHPAASFKKNKKEVSSNIYIIFFSFLICGCILTDFGFLFGLVSIIISWVYKLPSWIRIIAIIITAYFLIGFLYFYGIINLPSIVTIEE